jgi:outer membrane protein OmpA-like peptidoglycan-associated protein
VKEKTAVKTVNVALGVQYTFRPAGKPAAKMVNYSLSVLVKDELTGQPLPDADVTITSNDGNSSTAKTDAKGNAVFAKIKSSVYNVTGTLHGIATTTATSDVSGSNQYATVTLIHNDPRFTVKGKAINISFNRPEPGVNVSLTDKDRSTVKMGTSQSNGGFSFQLEANTDYQLVGKKSNYISNIENISTKGLTRSQTLYVELELGVEHVEIGKSIVLQKIFYDLDKAEIREDASTDLQKLARFLIDNPGYKVEIAAHTDARGSDEYNMELSQKRAQAVVNYLTANGIDKSRLIAKGYGETKLVNKCANGVNCGEEEHQQNRRTEFTLISQ